MRIPCEHLFRLSIRLSHCVHGVALVFLLSSASSSAAPTASTGQTSNLSAAKALQQPPTLSQDVLTRAPEREGVRVQTVVSHLQFPWSLAFLPDDSMLITERGGSLRWLAADGQAFNRLVSGLPKVLVQGQGGLFDVILHPQFAQNQLLFLSLNEADSQGQGGTVVYRAKLDLGSATKPEPRLTELVRLFSMQPKSATGQHFGGRMAFDAQQQLYLSLGDRGDMARAQKPQDHASCIVRIDPRQSTADAAMRPQAATVNKPSPCMTWGHRNVQGLAMHPKTGQLWAHEHGPQGGDEINRIIPGVNYGWPLITYGRNYGLGTRIGNTRQAGLVQPLHVWIPSIAPSGMAFYQGPVFAQWQGDLLVGALAGRALVRLTLSPAGRIVQETRYLENQYRIRDVRVNRHGEIYLLTDSANGALLKLTPL